MQVDGSVDDALLHRFGKSFHIDFQADLECRDRADGGTDDFVHAQLIGPLDLIAERVVAEYLLAFLDQCRVARRQARVGPCIDRADRSGQQRSEEHTSELQSLMRISYAVFCLTKTK